MPLRPCRLAAPTAPPLVLLFDDQTERRRLQDQLIQSEKMSAIGQLIAGIAHDLNNPLASVRRVRRFPDRGPQRAGRHSGSRSRSSRRKRSGPRTSSRTSWDLRGSRSTSAGRPACSRCSTTRFVLLRNQLMAHRVEARIEVEPDLPMPDIDPNQIQQVFVNLINNAAQAIASTGRPGTIAVRARPLARRRGHRRDRRRPGHVGDTRAQVFEPFFTTKAEGEGTGLGLSISQGIVKEHGGRIMLSSEEGNGSTFTVQLPSGTRPPAPPPDAREGTPSRRLRVLVVDDEPHILHYMRATLEAWGHVPVVAADGVDGLSVDR